MKHCWLGLPRSRCRQCDGDNESGFTVVELVVALALMAIVMAGLAPTINGALQAAANTNHRTVANSQAVAAVEQMRSVPYSQVGYTSDVPACTTTDPTSPFYNYRMQHQVDVATSALPSFGYTTSDHGVTYTVDSCVYWVGSSSNPTGQVYKQTVISVGWLDPAGSHTVNIVSDVYDCNGAPSGATTSSCAPAATTTTTAPPVGTPDPPTAAVATTGGWATVNLTWVPPATSPVNVDHYVIYYNTTGDFSTTYSVSPSIYGTAWSAGGLTPGAPYYFEVLSVATNGSMSSPSNLAGAQAGGTVNGSPCVISSIAVNPTQGILDPTGHLMNGTNVAGTQEFALSVNANANCVNVTVQYSDAHGLQYATVTPNGPGQLTGYTNLTSTVWSAGTDAFTVYVGGNEYTPVAQQLINNCFDTIDKHSGNPTMPPKC